MAPLSAHDFLTTSSAREAIPWMTSGDRIGRDPPD